MMVQLFFKAAISGVLIAAASEVGRRAPNFGALLASLPLVALLAMIWLWREKPDPVAIATFSTATFWYVLPSLPAFLAIPAMLRHGYSFWLSLGLGCALTFALYAVTTFSALKLGIRF